MCSLTHLIIQSASLELQLEKKEEREAHYLGQDFLSCLVYSLGIVLAIYIKEVFAGFSPP
jgi:hypothetical protein